MPRLLFRLIARWEIEEGVLLVEADIEYVRSKRMGECE